MYQIGVKIDNMGYFPNKKPCFFLQNNVLLMFDKFYSKR